MISYGPLALPVWLTYDFSAFRSRLFLRSQQTLASALTASSGIHGLPESEREGFEEMYSPRSLWRALHSIWWIGHADA